MIVWCVVGYTAYQLDAVFGHESLDTITGVYNGYIAAFVASFIVIVWVHDASVSFVVWLVRALIRKKEGHAK
jgi:hypothetical protein